MGRLTKAFHSFFDTNLILFIVALICLPGQPGDVLSPVPSLAEGGDYYEYI